MATVVPAKKGAAYIFYVGLPSQADPRTLQTSPTFAAGDVLVATDDGAPGNAATLPVFDADFTKRVKVSVSAGEMNGDNITIVFSDAAGAEWCDLIVNIQTVARQVDDLAYPATSGRSIVVDAAGLVDANTVKVGATGAGTAQTAGDLAALITTADAAIDVIDGLVDSLTTNLATVDTAVDDIETHVHTTIPGTITTVDTVVDAIKVQTDKLTFTVANQVDANIQYVNDTAVTGDGAAGTEWGPA